MKKKKALKKIKDKDGTILKPHAFMIESHHPVVGRILEVDGRKYKILDNHSDPTTGTFIKAMDDEDEDLIKEFDREVEELSEKLIEKVDIKRMIKEQIKKKTPQEIKTGLFILMKEDEGEVVEKVDGPGCYQFTLHHKELEFGFCSGGDIIDGGNEYR